MTTPETSRPAVPADKIRIPLLTALSLAAARPRS